MNDDLRSRAINVVRNKWGCLGDLPTSTVAAVWVTVYRAIEVVNAIEKEGGPDALVKDDLLGSGKLSSKFDEAILRIKFLEDMIPTIRSSEDRTADADLLVDILKWGIVDAGSMSRIGRALRRRFRKCDVLYGLPVPDEVLK